MATLLVDRARNERNASIAVCAKARGLAPLATVVGHATHSQEPASSALFTRAATGVLGAITDTRAQARAIVASQT